MCATPVDTHAAMNNHYNGINAHLNSLLQTPGTPQKPSLWASFHSKHITHLTDFLNRQLPQRYLALEEQSLQIRSADDSQEAGRRPRPDITVFQRGTTKGLTEVDGIQPTWQAELVDVLSKDELYRAVVIYEQDDTDLGKVVTRIELLSPSNKPGGTNHIAYHLKRIETLQAATPLVELDYLHETPSVLGGLPAYPGDPHSHPYTVAVTDPRPRWEEGNVKAYSFYVDEPLPTVPIPLGGEERLHFDFDAAYQYTFEVGRWQRIRTYNMTTLPARFETYSAADQERIRAVMGRS